MCFMFSGRPEPAAAPAQAAEEEATLRDGVTQAAAEGQTDSANDGLFLYVPLTVGWSALRCAKRRTLRHI